MAVIGIDLGTTGARAMVFDAALAPLGEAYQEYPLLRGAGGAVEQDANLWWALSANAVAQAVQRAGVTAGEVSAIGISSQGISFVPTDADFTPLCNAFSWLDTRAEEQTDALAGRFSAGEIFRITGKRLSAAYTLPKLMWLAENRPEIWTNCRHILLPHDFLAAKLTGRAVTTPTLAAGTMLYDIPAGEWSRELLEAFDIPAGLLPAVVPAGSAVGGLCGEAAERLGLPPGVVVAAGGQDQKCAALAAGLAPGRITVSLGTSAAITARSAAPPDPAFPFFPYFDGGLISEGVLNTAGLALRWFRDTLAPQASYAGLDELAAEYEGSAAALFLPLLNGDATPLWQPDARAGFQDLALGTTVGEMALAVMEGVAFLIRQNLDRLDPAGKAEISLFGGGSKSPLWCRVIAGATGRQVQLPSTAEAACQGAAMLAAQAASQAAAPPQPGTQAVYLPNPAHAAYYNSKYRAFLAWRGAGAP